MTQTLESQREKDKLFWSALAEKKTPSSKADEYQLKNTGGGSVHTAGQAQRTGGS